MSWYTQGTEGLKNEQERLEDLYDVSRFWVKAGERKELVLVDDKMFCIYEHSFKVNGSFNNYLTCLEGMYDDVRCCKIRGYRDKYYVGFLTGVDCSKWKDKKEKVHQFEMRLVPLKIRSMKKLEMKKQDMSKLDRETQGLACTKWMMSRTDDKSAAIGDDWSYLSDVDPEKMFEHVLYKGRHLSEMWAEAEADPEKMKRLQKTFQIQPNSEGILPRIVPPFNYFELLKPKDPKVVETILGGAESEGNSSYKGSYKPKSTESYDEDDIPF